MYFDHDGFNHRPAGGSCWTDLPGDEGLMLWSMRRMIVAWPRCHAVQAALHARYDANALGVEHLLRCWLTGLSRHARRQLVIGDPNCTLLLPDEDRLLTVLRPSTPEPVAAGAIAAVTANPLAVCLLPLAASLAATAQL